MSFKKIEISEITFFDADGNELIGAGAHGISDARLAVRHRRAVTCLLWELPIHAQFLSGSPALCHVLLDVHVRLCGRGRA